MQLSKRILSALFFLFLMHGALHAQQTILAMCVNPSGSFIPVRASTSGGSYQGALPQNVLTGLGTDGIYHFLQCDASGNLITGGSSGPIQTCDASTVPLYGSGVCDVTFTPAQLKLIGDSAGLGLLIHAPGANKAIVPSGNLSTLQYIFHTTPYGDGVSVLGEYSKSGNPSASAQTNFFIPDVDVNSTFSVFSGVYVGNDPGPQSATQNFENSDFSFATTNDVFDIGAITTSTLNSGGVDGGVNTSQITSGNAGLGYAVTDLVFLDCGAELFVDTVDGVTGAVLTYETVSASQGGGCTVGNGQETATSGAGTGLEIDVLTVGAVYRVDDLFNVTTCVDATGHVTAVDANGFITAYAFDTLGDDCLVQTGAPLTTVVGIGEGALIDITSITVTGDGDLRFIIPFTVIPVVTP